MAETPQSAYDVYSAVCTATAANVPTAGYAVTTASDGVELATTTLLGTSSTGTVDGIALTTGKFSQPIQVQREGRVDKSLLTWLGTGGLEALVIDSNGKPQRASAASGLLAGIVDKQGNAYLDLALQTSTLVVGGTSWSNPASAAYESKRSIKASTGTLYVAVGFNGGSDTYVQVFNSAAEPSSGAAPVFAFPVSASRPFSLDLPRGRAMSSGIYVGTSTTGPSYTADVNGAIYLVAEYN